MTNAEAVNWLINLTADIGKIEHQELWHYEQALSEIREMLEDMPTIEPQRIRGRWESTVIGKARHIRCSSCKVGYYAQDVPHDLSGNVAWKYCPECGADMRKEQEC